MSHPLLGDPGSLSALASSLRSRAVQLHADAEALRAALADAAPGWRGPSALERRRRAERLAEATATTADAMDACGRTLHSTATELAEAIARLRALEEEAGAAGLDVRDGTVERSWGITGVADAHSVDEAERVRAELERLLISPWPRRGLELLVHTGVADVVLPELSALRETVDEHKRHKDVYEHSLTVLQQAIDLEGPPLSGPDADPDHPVPAPDLVLRLAALLHDIGKPRTRRFEAGGGVSFHHHDVVGAKLTAKRMKALRFDKDTTKSVARLVELHLRFHGYGDQGWTDSAVRRYVRDAGDQLERLHILTRSDCTTRNRRKAERLEFAYDDLERRIAELAAQEELDATRPDLDGGQIMAILGIKPGPVVGRAYKFLLNLRIEEGPHTTDQAEKALKAWWAQQPESTQS